MEWSDNSPPTVHQMAADTRGHGIGEDGNGVRQGNDREQEGGHGTLGSTFVNQGQGDGRSGGAGHGSQQQPEGKIGGGERGIRDFQHPGCKQDDENRGDKAGE